MEPAIPMVDDLLASASKYAQSALDAHNSEEHELLSIFAVTALEHITKACLIQRHPALLLNLQAKDSWRSLLFLLGATEGRPERLLTVSLRDALTRVKDLFNSNANQNDLLQLIDMRDGAIHVAGNFAIEDRLLIAFLRQIDASLEDLCFDREQFWKTYLGVVKAMLSEETNRVKKLVELKIQQGRIKFDQNLAPYSTDVKQAIMATIRMVHENEAVCICPACKSTGIAIGENNFSIIFEEESNRTVLAKAVASFKANCFSCALCGLKLTSPEEMTAAGMDLTWDCDIPQEEFSVRYDILGFD